MTGGIKTKLLEGRRPTSWASLSVRFAIQPHGGGKDEGKSCPRRSTETLLDHQSFAETMSRGRASSKGLAGVSSPRAGRLFVGS